MIAHETQIPASNANDRKAPVALGINQDKYNRFFASSSDFFVKPWVSFEI